MCRSIKVLRQPGQAATTEEVSAAARQFVRKISGFNKPSKVNQEAFERAILEISDASDRLLKAIGVAKPHLARPLGDGAQAPHQHPD
jgi:hypothetical protein